jgi:hypothetical protein
MHRICKRYEKYFIHMPKICQKMQQNMQEKMSKYAENIKKICSKNTFIYAEKYDKYERWIYYGKYARKHAKLCKIC